MPLLTLLLILIGPFLVVAPGAIATAFQTPEFWRPGGKPRRPVTRPRPRPRPARTAVAW